MLNKRHTDWNEILPYVIFAYIRRIKNSQKWHLFLSVTAESFNPTDVILTRKEAQKLYNVNDYVKTVHQRLLGAKNCSDNIHNAQLKQLEYFNRNKKRNRW